MEVDLSRFSSVGFDRGASRLKEAFWVLVRCVFFAPSFPWPGTLRVFWLIRSRVNVHFPWRLDVGDHVWIGEECWLLNLAPIQIESHVCLSQRAFLCTGSHNFKTKTFDLIVRPIYVKSGAWIAAAAWVGPGVKVGSHAMLTAGSIATHDLPPFTICQGNPAVAIRERVINK